MAIITSEIGPNYAFNNMFGIYVKDQFQMCQTGLGQARWLNISSWLGLC